MALDYIGKGVYLLVCIFFVAGSSLAIKRILAEQSKPSTVWGFFNLFCFFVVIIVFSVFDINKLHIIWIFVLVYLLSSRKFAFQLGSILFNISCFLLRKPNLVIDHENLLANNYNEAISKNNIEANEKINADKLLYKSQKHADKGNYLKAMLEIERYNVLSDFIKRKDNKEKKLKTNEERNADTLLYKAQQHFAKGKYLKTIKICESILIDDANNFNSHLLIARCYRTEVLYEVSRFKKENCVSLVAKSIKHSEDAINIILDNYFGTDKLDKIILELKDMNKTLLKNYIIKNNADNKKIIKNEGSETIVFSAYLKDKLISFYKKGNDKFDNEYEKYLQYQENNFFYFFSKSPKK